MDIFKVYYFLSNKFNSTNYTNNENIYIYLLKIKIQTIYTI